MTKTLYSVENLRISIPSRNQNLKSMKPFLLTMLLGILWTSAFSGPATPGKALHFDGSNDWVDVGTTLPNLPQGNSPWTVEVWVKTSQTSIGNIVSWGNRSTNNRVGVAVRSNGAAFIGQFNDLTPGNTALINNGSWHHVAVVCRGTTSNNIQIYVDGSLKSQGLGALNVSGQALRLGRISNPDNDEYYGCTMDEVRIWNYARTSTEINAQKDQELLGCESGLIAYYNFNQGEAGGNNSTEDELNDGTGNNNIGTLVNFALTGSTSNWVGDAPTLTPATSTPITCQIVNATTTCIGESNGTATVNVIDAANGSIDYSWSGGSNSSNSTTQLITGLAVGTYVVTVTQCSQTTTCAVTITQGFDLKVFARPSSFGQHNISTANGSDGSLRTLVQGGVEPYSYSWRGPSTASGSWPTGLSAGTYFLEVTDDNGCKGLLGPWYLSAP